MTSGTSGHVIAVGGGLSLASCSCGERGTTLQMLDHALPLNIALLRDAIVADLGSSPELIAQAEDLLTRVTS